MAFKYPNRLGKRHLLCEYTEKARQILLKLGFDEVFLKPMWPDDEVKKQYGPEAPAILDRLYYLATLPRPDIGLSDKRKELILSKIPGFNKWDELKQILQDYKREKIDPGEDFTEALVTRLGIPTENAFFLIDNVFSELKNIIPRASNIALNSHITTAWFPTLAQIQDKENLPIMKFTFGWRYRREQREDPTHMKAHYNLSMVIMDKDFTIEDGKMLTEKFLREFGFDQIKFEKKPNQPAYYEKGTNFEVFVHDKKFGWVEVTEIGMYSSRALENYKIKYPVFNSGPGLGRIVMMREGLDDIRAVHFPEIYFSKPMTDEEIAKEVEIDQKAEGNDEMKIAEKIAEVAQKNGNEKSPCKFLAYKGKFMEKNIEVYVLEKEENTKLLGPAASNLIYVNEGDILGVKEGTGVRIKFGFIDAISHYFVCQIRDAIKKGDKNGFFQIKMAKTPADINIKVSEKARNYITSENKKIRLEGPIFTAVEFQVK